MVILFFLWGFLTSLNDILVPHLKSAFNLKHWQAQLIQFFFFGAYFVMSWPAGSIIKKVGYQKGIIIGLSLMGLGCLTFYPAAELVLYPIFLLALFILASGITLLQVAANPYVAVIGPEETAASRLNLAQGFNSLGHTIAPLFGAYLILTKTAAEVDVNSVKMPYVGLGLVLLVIAGIFFFIKLPSLKGDDENKEKFSITKYPHLMFGAFAIFCYVGAEIAVGSFLVEYFKLPEVLGMDGQTAGFYVSFYWGGAMIGRFLGAISMSTTSNKALKMIGIPVIAFLITIILTNNSGLDKNFAYGFGLMMLLNYLAFFLGKSLPNRVLAVFAFICVVMLFVTMATSGNIAMWSVLSIGLFNSIMWSNIFTLAIKGLKDDTSYGSSLLVMMIVGGAIIPLIQGLVADIAFVGVKYCYIVPMFAYLYLVFYGLTGYKVKNIAHG